MAYLLPGITRDRFDRVLNARLQKRICEKLDDHVVTWIHGYPQKLDKMQDEKLDERLDEYLGENFEERMKAIVEARLEAATELRMENYYSDREMKQAIWDRRVQRRFDEKMVQKVDQYLDCTMQQPSFGQSLGTKLSRKHEVKFMAKIAAGNDKAA